MIKKLDLADFVHFVLYLYNQKDINILLFCVCGYAPKRKLNKSRIKILVVINSILSYEISYIVF